MVFSGVKDRMNIRVVSYSVHDRFWLVPGGPGSDRFETADDHSSRSSFWQAGHCRHFTAGVLKPVIPKSVQLTLFLWMPDKCLHRSIYFPFFADTESALSEVAT